MANLPLPRVDVVVPIRNEERLLPDKVRNLRELDYPPLSLRFILIDGRSTDRSVALAEAAAAADPRFVVLHGAADKTLQLNQALAHCTADWVLVTDADTFLPARTLRALLSLALADPKVAIAGAYCRPDRGPRLDRLHWWLWNVSRRVETAVGSTSAVMGPCYLARRDWLPSFPADVVADDLFVSFSALADGRRIALAGLMAIERRGPAGALAAVFHKFRKGRAFLREVIRFLPAVPRMPSPMRGLFLWRAAAVLVAPGLILATLALGVMAAPVPGLGLLLVALGCCLAPPAMLSRSRAARRVTTACGVVGLGMVLAVVLCLALLSLALVPQRASFSRWRQEEV